MNIRRALSLVVVLLASVGASAHTLPFVENDYVRARELARKKKVPIFVEAWAPW